MEPAIKANKHRLSSKKKLVSTVSLGVGLLLLPAALVYLDPVLSYTKYNLRLENGTMMHELLQRPFQGLKLDVWVFNVTNAEAFLNGTDEKIKLHEVGPFIYQEIRTHEDIVINREPGVMWYTPKVRAVFVPEESIGNPQDIYLTVPNFPLLSVTALVGKYPYLVRQLFNLIVSNSQSKVFQKTSVQDILWGYEDPLLELAHKLMPGLVYFKSFGLINRLYDVDYDYQLQISTQDADKFAVKKSVRIKPKNKSDTKYYVKKTLILPNDTYEGEIFPMELSPDRLLHFYRPSICRTLQFQRVGSKPMFYGGDAFICGMRNSTMNDHQMCDSKGWCPDGLMNMSPCYFDLPVVVSKGHFLDADPRLLEQVEGLKPDRKLHDVELIIDPKVGVTVTARMSLQMSLFLSDMEYNPETRRLQDIVLPIAHYTINSPPLIEEALSALLFVHKDGPRMLLATQICCALLGLAFLVYSAKLLYCNWLVRNNALNSNTEVFCKVNRPLMTGYEYGPTNMVT